MKLFLFVLFCCTGILIHAQKTPDVKFGTVDLADLQMKYDSKDSSSEAACLYDFEDISFEGYNGMPQVMITKYHERIKIFKKSALNRGTIIIPYLENINDDKESIKNFEAIVYNLVDGKEVKTILEKESIFTEKVDEYHSQKKIILPNVKEGAVIEYRYTKVSPLSIREEPETWYFQSDIPFRWSEMNITIPASHYYKVIFGGYLRYTINTKEETSLSYGSNTVSAMKYKLAVKDAPAFKNEPYTGNINDYVSSVSFELTSINYSDRVWHFSETWNHVYKLLMDRENFGERMKERSYLKDEVKALSILSDSAEKVNAAFEYIAKTMKWNGYYGKYMNESLRKSFENKTGSCAEINMMLVLLLKELGFDANPVLISSRSNGLINPEFPSIDKFNYIIAQVKLKGRDLLMDATEPLSKPGLIPVRCLNKNGLVLGKDSCSLIPIVPAEKLASLITINADIDSLGQISGSYNASYNGYKALDLRHFYHERNPGEFNTMIKNSNTDWQIDHISINNENKPFEPLKIKFDFQATDNAERTGTIYLNPLLAEKISRNPFNEKERIYPIDLIYPTEQIYIGSIKIPKGYAVEELPKSISLVLPDKSGKYTYILDQADGIIRVKTQLSITKTDFKPEQYYFLREFYKAIVQKNEEVIVFKRN